jgi:hypothetical protein
LRAEVRVHRPYQKPGGRNLVAYLLTDYVFLAKGSERDPHKGLDMRVEIDGAGTWIAGPLNWPAGGYPTTVWFMRRRGEAIDQLIAPWFRDAHLSEEGLRTAFDLSKQRLWVGAIPGRFVHLTLTDERTPGAPSSGQSVLVRGPGMDGVTALPRDVPLGHLTDEEVSALVKEVANGSS